MDSHGRRLYLLRQLGMFGGAGRSLAESGQVRLLALLTTLMGVLNVLAAVQPSLLTPIAALTVLSPVAIQGSRITAVISGFLLLALAQGLWRHKRAAWWLTLIVLAPSITSHILQRDSVAAALGLLLLLFLVSQRAHFVARSDPPSTWHGLQVLLAALAFTLTYGIVGFYLLDRYYGNAFSLQRAWQQTLLLFTTMMEPTLTPKTAFDYFADSIFVVGLSVLAYALIMLLRPVVTPILATERERRRAEGIVAEYGRSAFAALISLPDRAYYFSPGGSVVAYIKQGRMVVALGDPVGPEDDRQAAIQGFRDHCRLHDWETAFYRTLPGDLPAYMAAGLQTLCIGQEAVVDLTNLVLPPTSPGYTVQFYQPPYPPALLEQLRLVNDAWLAGTGQRERPFIGERFGRAYLYRGILAVAYDKANTAVAVASLFAAPDRHELLLGLLRYYSQTERDALVELLAATAVWAKEQGYRRLDLGLSATIAEAMPFPLTRWQRLLRQVHLRLSREDQLDDLRPLQACLQPMWEPRYLVFPGPASLPSVSAALSRATDIYST
ncbi:MAG: phosphatidylglycerol lysyltransferase domain-containing protein [Chloroflexota bacterium]